MTSNCGVANGSECVTKFIQLSARSILVPRVFVPYCTGTAQALAQASFVSRPLVKGSEDPGYEGVVGRANKDFAWATGPSTQQIVLK